MPRSQNPLRVTIIGPGDLSPDDERRWRSLQRTHPAFESPYFCPEFTRAAAAVNARVRIAVLEQDGERVGYFPFERDTFGFGRPLADGMSDFHGPLIRPGVAWSARELIARCGLPTWDFDHLIGSEDAFSPFVTDVAASPYMDLSKGFDVYARGRARPSRPPFSTPMNLSRQIERDHGPLRFEIHDTTVLEQVILWKEAKAGVRMSARQKDLLRTVASMRSDEFTGSVSALYAGGELAAAHIGMRSRTVWHYWFPAYEAALARYSPGNILLIKMAECAPGLGVTRIDLGKGGEDYKQRLMSGALQVATGSVRIPSVAASVLAGAERLVALGRSLPIQGPLRAGGRRVLRLWQSLVEG